jgi:cyclic lactone autoinducer peptide
MRKTLLYIGQALVALAIIAAPVASDICKITWYQPEEPEGLKNFAKRTRRDS